MSHPGNAATKQGSTLASRLYGGPGRFADGMDEAALAAENGGEYFIGRMATFKDAEEDLSWIHYRKLNRRKRLRGELAREYTMDWEQLYHDAVQHESIDISDGLKTYMYLDSLGISGDAIKTLIGNLSGCMESIVSSHSSIWITPLDSRAGS